MTKFRSTIHAFDASRAQLGGIHADERDVHIDLPHGGDFQLRITSLDGRGGAQWGSWTHLTHKRVSPTAEGVRHSPIQRHSGGDSGGVAESLCVSIAPQEATTLAEYRALAHHWLQALLPEAQGEMVFDHEWWRYCHYGESSDLFKMLVEPLVDLSQWDLDMLANYTSLEVVSGPSGELSVELYYDNISELRIPRGSDHTVSELALLLEVDASDVSPWRSLEGVRAVIPSSGELELLPMLVFPMAQHSSDLTLSARHDFAAEQTLHPLYKVALEGDFYTAVAGGCSLHFTLDLPKQFILDGHQLEGLRGRPGDETCILQMDISNNGKIDLELPDYEVAEFGSVIHLDLDSQCVAANGGFQLPLHLRYGAPNGEGFQTVVVPPGDVYWKCPVIDEAQWESITHSFMYDEGTLGITKLDHQLERVTYHHVFNTGSEMSITFPVALISHLKTTEYATMALIIIGSLFILFKCVNPFRK